MTVVLLVEDDETLRLALGAALQRAGHEVVGVPSAAAAVDALSAHSPAAIVLDLGLPDADGATVLAAVRAAGPIPVVVLSARDQRDEKVALLRAGADDYVTKPFDTEELLARLEAVLRRATHPSPRRLTVDGDLEIDLDRALVRRGADAVALTPTELRLLDALIAGDGRLLRHEELLRAVWGAQYGTESEYLRTFVGQLRRKLGDDAARPRLIRTHPGIGYRWVASSGGSAADT